MAFVQTIIRHAPRSVGHPKHLIMQIYSNNLRSLCLLGGSLHRCWSCPYQHASIHHEVGLARYTLWYSPHDGLKHADANTHGVWVTFVGQNHAIRLEKASQRGIVVPRIIKQQAGARIFALAGVAVFGAALRFCLLWQKLPSCLLHCKCYK